MSKYFWLGPFVLTVAGIALFYYASGRPLSVLNGYTPVPVPVSRGKTNRLPTTLIIGVKKGGTRAILEMLRMHPRIAAAHKEVHFFDREENYDLGASWYKGQMPASNPQQVVMEKSPAYFVTPTVPQRVWQMNPSMRLILLLRNPVTRAVSDFMQGFHRRLGYAVRLADLDSSELKRMQNRVRNRVMKKGQVNAQSGAIGIGLYHTHLRRWLALFPRNQIFVTSSEEFTSNPVAVLVKLEKFLGVHRPTAFPWSDHVRREPNKKFYCLRYPEGMVAHVPESDGKRCLQDTKGREHIPLPPDLEERLYKFYAPHNEKLFKLLGTRFNWARTKR